MTGIKTIKSFNTENFEQKKINNEIDNLLKLTLKSTKVNSVARPLMETLGGLAIALIIYIGGKEVLSGNTTPELFFILDCIDNGLSTCKIFGKFKCYASNGNGLS